MSVHARAQRRRHRAIKYSAGIGRLLGWSPVAAYHTVDLEGSVEDTELVERKGNPLLNETSLMLDSCVVGIRGMPGLGKSAFAESACSWWQLANLIDCFVKTNLAALGTESLAEALDRELSLDLPADATKTKKRGQLTVKRIKRTLQKLKQCRAGAGRRDQLLLLFKGVNDGNPQGIADADQKLLNRLLLAFDKAQASLKPRYLPRQDDDAGQNDAAASYVYQDFVPAAARELSTQVHPV